MPAIPYVRATHVDGQSWSAAKANLLEAGVNDTSYAPAVRAYHNANTSITNNVDTAFGFATGDRFDQAGNAASTMHDTSTNNTRLTAIYAGVYQITASVLWAAVNTTGYRQVRIRLNGTTFIGHQRDLAPSATVDSALSCTTLYQLAVNDYVEMMVYQNSGGALNLLVAANVSPEFMMVRVA